MALLAWVSLDMELSHLCLCRPWLHHVWFSYSFLTRTPAVAVRVTRILYGFGFTNDLCRDPILRQGSEMNFGGDNIQAKTGEHIGVDRTVRCVSMSAVAVKCAPWPLSI